MSSRIQQIYDNLADVFWALYSFSKLEDIDISGEFGDDIRLSAERTAIQNLISLSALTRNLIEGTKSISESKSFSIRLLIIDYRQSHKNPEYSSSSINLYQAMSRIIHSKNLDVAKDTVSLRPLPRDIVDAYAFVMASKPIDPVICCETESDGACRFTLSDLLKCISECINKILEKKDIDGLMPRNIRDA